MKKLIMILCTILCANILAAQTFTSGGLRYWVIDNSYSVRVAQQNSSDISGSVVIPSTVTYNNTTYRVTSIWNNAFNGCSGLTSVTIPNSVTYIGEQAFRGCSGLTSINVDWRNPHYSSIDGVLYNDFQDTLIQCPGAKTSVTIPTGVTSIGNSAFRGCSGLTSVTIPTGVTSIGDWAFSDCSGLTSVTIPNSVTFIGWSTFNGCSGLTSVTIPNSVTSIGGWAFYNCRGLTTLNFNAINCQDFSSLRHPFSGISLTTVNIGDSVQRIPAYFVRGCSGLTSVTIPNSVTSIGIDAFYGCSGLTSVTIPNSVTSIGIYAFYGCSGLTSVTIPNSVTYIGNSAFNGCSGLTSVTIPNSVTSIGWSTFNGCSGLTSVTIPNSVTYIGWSAFYGCSGLTSVTIPNSVTSISDSAFYGCSGLTSITIPNSVTYIRNSAFYGCSGLTSVKCLASIPPSIGNNSFQNISATCTLTVPCGSLEAYTASDWNTYFASRISEDLSFELSVSANDEAYGRVAFEAQSCEVATITATPNEGYEFTAWNDGNTENPRTVTVTSDTAFMAIFTETETTPTITVTVNDETMGSATYTMDGNTAVLTATANEGYSFLTWSDGNAENPRTVTVTSDTTFMAIFAETETTPTITVTVNDATMGSATYTLDGNTAVLTATANEGYSFLTWSDGNTENPRTVTITSDTAFMAIFAEAVSTPTITVTVNDATMGSASYTLDGNTAVLTATPNEGYSFVIWNDGNTENPRTVTITSDTTFMAIFSPASSLQEVNAREFALYPNPAKSFVTLEFETLKENTLLQILDLNGRRVRTLDLKAGIETLRIDLGDLPKGIYTIMLGNTTKKLIVE